ncbi:MAG: TonB-dependent receptor [Alteromonadaceae bacterium]|nr:TonB-dependent receptor [Alteromonadaceae bacterium]
MSRILSAFSLLILSQIVWAKSVPDLSAVPDLSEELAFLRSEMVIEAATKTAIKASDAPGAVTVIGLEQIRNSTATSIPELLRLVAGVNVRWNPMMQTITIRGFGQSPFSSRVLLLIDGVPYNSWNKGGFPQQPGLDFFPLENVKRLEVIKGSGSALYGENAYWGVLNIVSISGADLEGTRVKALVGDRNTTNVSVQTGASVMDGDAEYLVSVKSGVSQFPVGFYFNSDAEPENESVELFTKGRYKNFTASYYRHESDADGFNYPLFPGASFQSIDNIEQTVEIFAANYQYETSDKKYSFSGDVSYARREGSSCASCHAAQQNIQNDPTLGLFPEQADHGDLFIADIKMGIREWAGHDILVGIETRDQDTGSHSDGLLRPGDEPEGARPVVYDYSKSAIYVQDMISLMDDELTLTLGARYDTKTDPGLFGDTLSPRASVVYQVNDELTIRGGWNRSFRYPSPSEMYQNNWFIGAVTEQAAFPLSVFRPNTELDPESITSFEFGIEYELSDSWHAKSDFYYSQVKDFIVQVGVSSEVPGGSYIQFENHGNDARLIGLETEFRFNYDENLYGFFSWVYQDGSQSGNAVDSSGREIEFVYMPENKFNFVTFYNPTENWQTSLEMIWYDEVQAPEFWSSFTQKTSLASYTTINASVSYQPNVSWGDFEAPLRFTLYAKDLLDEAQEETMLPIDSTSPGTEYFLSAEILF